MAMRDKEQFEGCSRGPNVHFGYSQILSKTSENNLACCDPHNHLRKSKISTKYSIFQKKMKIQDFNMIYLKIRKHNSYLLIEY